MELVTIVTGPSLPTLATEIKLDIFDNIRSRRDQGNARLVCKVHSNKQNALVESDRFQQWNELMRPRRWNDTNTTLLGNQYDSLHSLPEHEKACSYDIRNLTVGGDTTEHQYKERLSNLLNSLHEDQLLGFKSGTDAPIRATQLLNLLHRQTRLTSLKMRLDFSTVTDEDVSSWIMEAVPALAPALEGIKQSRGYVGDPQIDGEEQQYLQRLEVEFFWSLLRTVSKLDCLEICGWRWQSMPRSQRVPILGLFERASVTHVDFLVLNELILSEMDLTGIGSILIPAFSLSTLTSLELEFCDNVGGLLHALAAALRQESSISLHSLAVRTNQWGRAGENTCLKLGMDDLLTSFGSLVNLECSSFQATEVDWRIVLAQHTRLERLHVESFIMKDNLLHLWPKIIANMLVSAVS